MVEIIWMITLSVVAMTIFMATVSMTTVTVALATLAMATLAMMVEYKKASEVYNFVNDKYLIRVLSV